MYGIYVNSTGCIPYADAIAQGYKTIETRSRDMLGRLVGERVAIIKTRRSKSPSIVGYATITGKFFCPVDKFDSYRNMTLIPTGSKYDCHGKGKWMYTMSEATSCTPYALPKNKVINHGRSYCEY